MIAGIETGGTKVVCGLARRDTPNEVVSSRRFPTGTPGATIREINAFLTEAAVAEPIDALGIGTFGPVNVIAELPRYGWITGTPKPGWADTDLLGSIDLPRGCPLPCSATSVGPLWGSSAGAPG